MEEGKRKKRLWKYDKCLIGMLALLFIFLTGCGIGEKEHQMTKLDSRYLPEQEQSAFSTEKPQETPASAVQTPGTTPGAVSGKEAQGKKQTKQKKDSTKVESNKQVLSKTNKKTSGDSHKKSSSHSPAQNKTSNKKSTSKQTEKQAQRKKNITTVATPLPQNGTKDKTTKPVCTVSIDCRNILSNKDRLKSAKEAFVPSDGWILKRTSVEIEPGDSAYDVLNRVCRKYKIHMEASYTPAYRSYYVEGINQLYECDCGDLSGWSFLVNGKLLNYGCSKYMVANGDVICWRYTCNAGKDMDDLYFD